MRLCHRLEPHELVPLGTFSFPPAARSPLALLLEAAPASPCRVCQHPLTRGDFCFSQPLCHIPPPTQCDSLYVLTSSNLQLLHPSGLCQRQTSRFSGNEKHREQCCLMATGTGWPVAKPSHSEFLKFPHMHEG